MTSSLLASSPGYRRQIEAVQPLKGVGSATDIARIAVMLASDDVGWVTGIAMAVDGGFLCQ
jgi:NAD(P)-dependent dehydrogenase (short-subunit alcohol dehydrogenase family)